MIRFGISFAQGAFGHNLRRSHLVARKDLPRANPVSGSLIIRRQTSFCVFAQVGQLDQHPSIQILG